MESDKTLQRLWKERDALSKFNYAEYARIRNALSGIEATFTEEWKKSIGERLARRDSAINREVVKYVREVVAQAAKETGAKKKEVLYAWLYGATSESFTSKVTTYFVPDNDEPTDEESAAWERGYRRACEDLRR